jgi:hypothetical protein
MYPSENSMLLMGARCETKLSFFPPLENQPVKGQAVPVVKSDGWRAFVQKNGKCAAASTLFL